MLFNRPVDDWIAEYERSHQKPVNRGFHMIGIPMILASLPLLLVSIFSHSTRRVAFSLFLNGWMYQFIGHMIEGQPPEFLHDPRFLLVGIRWWLHQVRQFAGRSLPPLT